MSRTSLYAASFNIEWLNIVSDLRLSGPKRDWVAVPGTLCLVCLNRIDCTLYWQPVIPSAVDRTMMQGIMRGMVHWWLFVSCSGFGGAYGMKHWDALSALDHERLMWVQFFQRGIGHRPFRVSQKGLWAPS